MREFGVDFAEDVKIDKKKLDEEAVYQPAMYFCWAERLANARNTLDLATSNEKATKARRELHHRRNPPSDLKVTEGVISALVAEDRETQDAIDATNAAQAAVNTLYAAVNAADQRKGSVDNLVKMSISQYYGSAEVNTTRTRYSE